MISTLGVLIKHRHDTFPDLLNPKAFNYWLSNLPLEYDYKEGKKQQEFLIHILNHNPSLVIGKVEDLKKVLEIFVCYLKKRKGKEDMEIIKKSRECLFMINGWSLFR